MEPVGSTLWPVPAAQAGLWLAWSPLGLTHALWVASDAGRPEEIAAATPELPAPAEYAELLGAYFAGEPVDPTALPVDLSGSPFQLKVWQALRRIARGRIRSYAGIANDIAQPRATRAVGMANSRNPVAVVVPCHRVVEKDLRIGGYTSGLSLKRFLLALEGVPVVGDVVQPGQLTLI
jgi:methylated-DNA-[protein]-cysteine S-methyltransferase